MRFESKVAVKSMIYKNYDGTTNRFISKEFRLRNVFIVIYIIFVLSGSVQYIISMVTTNKFNLGITKVGDEEAPYFPFNFHILAFELTINEFSGVDLIQDVCIKCC